jgi:hypothetical protein
MAHDVAVENTSILVSCFWCERLHPGELPLSVCPECATRYSTMRSLEMRGSYPLDAEAIEDVIQHTSPGNYALGYLDGDRFSVFYVGRSDSDLTQRLHRWPRPRGACSTERDFPSTPRRLLASGTQQARTRASPTATPGLQRMRTQRSGGTTTPLEAAVGSTTPASPADRGKW